MTLNSDISSALQLLENIQVTINQSDDVKLQAQSSDDLNLLINLLENPIFRSVVQIQDSLSELNNEIQQHPSILPVDFDLTPSGELLITAPQPTYQTEFISSPNPEIDDQRVPVAKLSHSSSGEPNSPQVINSPGPEDIPVTPITSSAYVREFQKALEENSQNRDVVVIQLFKPEGYSLGFSVVGLKSEEKGELGIFVQEIQAAGIAGRDGRLREGDQILAIDGQPLDSNISHQQAISILQKARGLVELVVARTEDNPPTSPTSSPTPSAISETSKAGSDMVLNTEWAQVEVIDLINDGSGLGFGIIGGRSTGVVVKTILPAGVADRDGRLQSGDHILQIGDVNLRGMGSEQVAAVLRQSGSHVRLVVARPVEPTSPDYQALGSHAPIVPTKILNDPEELDRHLVQNGYPQVTYTSSSASSYDNPFIFNRDSDDIERDPRLVDMVPSINTPLPLPLLTMDMIPLDAALPEMERFSVELKKDSQGLGITIAGYVCEKEELSGIFVKSISDGSAADLCKKIQVNDRIVEVDGQSLQGFTNHDAVEVLRSTGASVQLTLERYLRGPKFEQLQQAIANSELKPSPSSPSAVSLPQFPLSTDGESTEIEVEGESITTMDSVVLNEINTLECDTIDLDYLVDDDYSGVLKPSVELAIKSKWSSIMGPDVDIVVGQLCKFNEGGGLGISLEGTVDVEDGQEVRPHHYIRSILAEGPVGQNGKLRSGDELLEVNGHRLLGMNHIEVVTILKELPMAVRMVCARRKGENPPLRLIDTSQDRAAFAARNILGGSLQNLIPSMDRLVKAKSDGSLASNTTVGTEPNLSKLRSRSLEPITGLAMWSSEPHIIDLTKGDRGLGFSILDYQDPMNPSETVIVIRSLVPGGVAQIDGRLIPGDRLLSVNSVSLDNASLDQAVQALKGAPKGTVRITVAKPLPIPDSISHSQDTDEGLSQNTPTLDDHSMYSCSGSLNSGRDQDLELETDAILDPLPEDYPECDGEKFQEDVSIKSPDLQEDVSFKSPDFQEDVSFKSPDFQEDVSFKSPDFQEDVSFKSPDFQEDVSFKSPEPEMSDSLEREFVESPGEKVSACALLDSLESEITIHIDKRDYGFALESLEDGFNGAIVTALTSGGVASPAETYLKVGDIITWINDKCLRNSSPNEIKRIIEEVQLPSTFIKLKYISKKTALEYFNQIDHSQENIKLFKVFSKYWDLSLARGGSIERRTRSALCSPVGRDSPSDKESEYVDCDCLDERTSTSVAIVPEEPEPLTWKETPPDTSPVEQTDQPELLPSEPIEPTRPVVPTCVPQRTNPLESLISFDRTKVPDDTAHKSPLLDSLITSSLESLNNFNIKLGKELTKGVSEPILNKNCVDISEVFSFNRNLKGSEMTVTQGSSAAVILAKHWGPQRSVQVFRESEKSLGISIVGGKVDLYNTSRKTVSTVSGIFIKNVIQNSPAGKTGALKTGDRILQVDGIDLTNASHETAVYVIRSAGNPVNFLVQSLVYRDIDLQTGDIIPNKGNGAINHKKVPIKKAVSDSSESSDDDDANEEDLESKVRTPAGVEISRASAGNVKRSAEEKAEDPEEEDEFGYTTSKCLVGVEPRDTTSSPTNINILREIHEKALKKYEHLGSEIVLVELEKSGSSGLGIALAGHKDRNRMAALICGLYPEGQAYAAGTLAVGDEILEVNGIVVHNRCHLNASAIIKGLPGPKYKIIVLRKTNSDDLSVRPITQFPFYLQDKAFEQSYDSFKGVRVVTIKKQSGQGLGIMIIEGKHAEVGQGIFISDIQDGSVAQQAGLNVGDMILAVNKDDIMGANYDTAADTLKKTEGVVTLTVCSPNKAQKEEKKSELPVSPASNKAPSNQATPKALSGTPSGKSGGGQSPCVKSKSDWDEAGAATAPITPSSDCLIEITRDKLPIGFSVVGGSDTPLGCVFVHEVYPDGAAGKDGRLKPGDKILEMCGEDCRSITNEKVNNLIKAGTPKYRMVVFRREGSYDTAQGYDAIEVEIAKKGGKGLGICLVARKSGQGVFINEIVPGGSAVSESKIMIGDTILAVNGQDTLSMPADEVATHIKTSSGKVTLKLGRYKAS